MATWMTGSGKDMDSRMTGGALGAQGVAGGDVLEADEGVDVPGVGLLDRVLLVGVHLEEFCRRAPSCPWWR